MRSFLFQFIHGTHQGRKAGDLLPREGGKEEDGGQVTTGSVQPGVSGCTRNALTTR